jgi:hypothetical protein
MKKNILLLFVIFNCLVLSGCIAYYYKSYEKIDKMKKADYVNEVGIYFEVFGSKYKVSNKNEIKDIFDSVRLVLFSSEKPKSIILHWYKIKLNEELKYSKILEERIDYEYIEKYNGYYPEKKVIWKFDLQSKTKDKITVIVNVTVISDGKEETKTIEKTFVVYVKTMTYLAEKIYNILSV